MVESVVVCQRGGEVVRRRGERRGGRGAARRHVGALVVRLLVGLGARLALDLAVGRRYDGRHYVPRRHVLAWNMEGYF